MRRRIGWGLLGVVVIAGVAALLALRYRPEPVRTATAVPDATCLSCHAEQATYEGTAHRMTSRPPTRGAIAGRFDRGANELRTTNPYLHYRMDSTADGFTQTAVFGAPPDTTWRTERFAYVVGSGRKGQSYIYRRDHDQLFQLPVSQWTGLGWTNSPGFTDGVANFDRTITPRCLECHATGFTPVADAHRVNRFARAPAPVLGLTCEKCHAAGREHVERERSVLRALMSRAIVNPARLSRQRRIEGCALCHGGVGEPKAASFTYVPGTPLREHLEIRPAAPNEVDVHGNQVALLARSRCFRASEMTCSTCHDVHRTQRDIGQLAGRCLTCHTPQSCGLYPTRGEAIVGRCVDCHMPLQRSNTIISGHEGRQERPVVRTHWIKVYPGR
ncbi:MAG: multiheme c-type cytochrome [Gemmatimonadaceae bacterium]